MDVLSIYPAIGKTYTTQEKTDLTDCLLGDKVHHTIGYANPDLRWAAGLIFAGYGSASNTETYQDASKEKENVYARCEATRH